MNIIRISTPSVSPANWQSPRCSLKKDWFISYYIYTDKSRTKKVVKNMNRFKTYPERYKATKELLEAEIQKLTKPQETVSDSATFVPKGTFRSVSEALLDMVEKKRKTCVARHCDNLETKVKRFCQVADNEGIQLKLQDVSRQDCLLILDAMVKYYPTFTDKTYNAYIKDVGTLFADLLYWEYTKYNPFYKMRKRQVVKELKVVATETQRKLIDRHLKQYHYCFWRFMHIFFHSGAREAELCRMKASDIHLSERYFIVEIRKGRSKRKEIKAMLPGAYPHWAEIVAENKPYPFSHDFQPGDQPINEDRVNKTWKTFVKDQLKITNVDFYSLKHLHTDMIESMADLDLAQTHDDHLEQKTTENIYAVGRKKRKLDKLKQLDIKF